MGMVGTATALSREKECKTRPTGRNPCTLHRSTERRTVKSSAAAGATTPVVAAAAMAAATTRLRRP
eukprot:2685852-Lingulodinium_polyedra.AAC.1